MWRLTADESVTELHKIVNILPRFSSEELRASVVKINSIEDQADDLFDESLTSLFQELDAPVTVSMQIWSEIYRLLEDVTDHCQDAADTLMSIARKEGY